MINYQDVANKLYALEQSRRDKYDMIYDKMLHNDQLRSIIEELSEGEE